MKTQSEPSDMVFDSQCTISNIQVEDRIENSGYIGTVKYIGPVEGYSSEWLGIDWDDESRGKHNGTINGVRYFETRRPKSGSFIRPHKVYLGHSAEVSIITRYGSEQDQQTTHQLQQKLFHFQQSINAPFLEMVGFEKVTDKQSHFNNLEVVNLRLQNIKCAGEPGRLRQLCPNVKELDLSKNLISSWINVFEICSELNHLTWLNVSENILTIPDNLAGYKYPSVTTLICTSMNLMWKELAQIMKAFPNLKELRAPCNLLKELDTPTDILKNLKILDIEDNPIEKWSEICKLDVLKNLEELYIANIGITNIQFPGDESKVDIFKKVMKLSISSNLIDNWDSLNELNRLKSLKDLRFIKNPILDTENEATRFQIIVARLGNLKILNGTEIKPNIRKDSEYDYLKMYGLEWLKIRGTEKEKEFLKLHNRYLELVQAHGAPDEATIATKSKLLSDSLVTLNLVHDGETITRKLPVTLLVQKVMALVQKLFHLDDAPELIYICGSDENFKLTLEPQRNLSFYSIQDGDIIMVDAT